MIRLLVALSVAFSASSAFAQNYGGYPTYSSRTYYTYIPTNPSYTTPGYTAPSYSVPSYRGPLYMSPQYNYGTHRSTHGGYHFRY